MGLESATYISDLNAANPVATADKASESGGAAHIRLIKRTLQSTFPNISGAVTPTHTELNYVDGVTSSIQDQLDSKRSFVLSVKTANFNAENGYRYVCRSVSPIICRVPASPVQGDMFDVFNEGSGNVVVYGPSVTLFLTNGVSTTLTVTAGGYVSLIYIDSTTGWAHFDS